LTQLIKPAGMVFAVWLFVSPCASWGQSPEEEGPVKTFQKDTHAQSHLSFSPDGRYIASAPDGNGMYKLWDVSSGKLLRVLDKSSAVKYKIAFSPDGRHVAAASDRFYVWETATGKTIHALPGHPGKRVYSVSFSPDGKTVATAGCDTTTRIWSLETGGLVRVIPYDREEACVHSAVFSPDGKTLAIGGVCQNNVTFSLWDAGTGEQNKKIVVVPDDVDIIDQLAYSPDGKYLAVRAYAKREAWIFKAASGELVRRLEEPGVPGEPSQPFKLDKFCFSPNGRYLACLHNFNEIAIFEVDNGVLVKRIPTEAHQGPTYALAFSPDGKYLATGGEGLPKLTGRQILLWSVADLP